MAFQKLYKLGGKMQRGVSVKPLKRKKMHSTTRTTRTIMTTTLENTLKIILNT